MKKAKTNNCILEINSQPSRLDLNDIHCKMAKDMGLKFVISTDSHSTNDYNYISYGISQARRGWIEVHDVINTKSIDELRKCLRKNFS